MRALILSILILAAPTLAHADPASAELEWSEIYAPVADQTNVRIRAIRASCVMPMCNPGMLQAEIESKHAAALARCEAVNAGNPSETALCIRFENVVFQ